MLLAGTSVVPISISVGGNDTGNDASSGGSASADGRYIAFTSEATNLVSGQTDTPNSPDVFLFDVETQAITLVSHANGAPSTAAAGFSYAAVVSADGNFVVYYSTASNLVDGQVDNNNGGGGGFLDGNDIFLFNRQTGETQLVSRVAGSTNIAGNVESGDSGFGTGNAAISSDGRYVAFVSQATDLTPLTSDFNGIADVFLFDATANTVQLISRSNSSALVTADGASLNPIISGDGRFVAYTSSSSDLVEGQVEQNGSWDLFLFDRDAVGIPNRLVSGTNGSATQTASGVTFSDLKMDLSDDGQFLVFKSFATDLISGATDENNNSDIFLFNRLEVPGANITLVSHAAGLLTTAATGGSASSETPTISGDGRYVAYKSTASNIVTGDSNTFYDVFVFDRVDSSNTLVSHAANSTASANGVSSNPLISDDGTFVAFASTSTNLVTGQVDFNGGDDVFLFDRTMGTTSLVSGAAGSATTAANQTSIVSDINLDGRRVVLLSSAANLTGVDTNGQQDVFINQTVVPNFAFHDTTFTIEENGGAVRIRVDRSGDVSTLAAVDYRLVSGTATSGSDFVLVSDTLVFAAGETTLTFDITILDDVLLEASETFTVELFNPSPGSILAVPSMATVTIVDQDTAVMSNQVIEADGDIVVVSLSGPGTFSLTLDDPDGNGKGPLLVALSGTNASSSMLTFTVTKKNGDGFANVGAITGDGGLKGLAGADVNLTGSGLSLSGTVLTLALHDVLNGADITLGGSASDSIKITLHEVKDNTTVTLGSGVKTFTAAKMGRGNIFGTSIQTLSIKGDKSNNIRGDMYSNVYLSGQGIASGKNTLNKVTISHALTDAIFSVYSGLGGIGIVAAGRMVRSGISAGYTPANFNAPLAGGTFGPALNIKGVAIKGLKDGPAFTNSLIAATTVGKVSLGSVDLTTLPDTMPDYGVIADTSIAQVTVKSPAFKLIKMGSGDQSISRFHVKVI